MYFPCVFSHCEYPEETRIDRSLCLSYQNRLSLTIFRKTRYRPIYKLVHYHALPVIKRTVNFKKCFGIVRQTRRRVEWP